MGTVQWIQFVAHLAVLLGGVVYGGKSLKYMDTPLKIFYLWLVIVFANDCITFYLVRNNLSRIWLSHLYSFFEITLLVLFFIYVNSSKPRSIVSVSVVALAFVVCLVNYLFIQNNEYNTAVLLVECLVFTCMSLYSLYKMITQDKMHHLRQRLQIRLWIGILVLWSTTFFYWSFLLILFDLHKKYILWLNSGQLMLNSMVYAYFACQFYILYNHYRSPLSEDLKG